MKKPINALLAAQALSILGSAISAIAIPWLLLDAHVDPSQMALVFMAQSGAALLAAVLGTPFLDRIEKKVAYIGCDILLALSCFALIVLYSTKSLNPGLIAVILASTAVISAFASAVGSAMIPELLKGDEVENQRVNGLIGTFHNFGDLAGPVLGGLLIASVGAAASITIDGLSFLLSALLLALFIPKMKIQATQHEPVAGRNEYLAGVKEIASTPVLFNVTVISAIINMVITPLLVMLLPFMVKHSGGGALNVGILISCFGVGAFLASMLYTFKNTKPISPFHGLAASLFVALSCFVLIPLAPTMLTYPLLLLIGASVGYLGPLEQTLMQTRAQASQLGRVMLAYSAFRTMFVPFGYLLTGQVLAKMDVAAAFFALALLLLIALLSLVYSRLRDARSWV